tara:strand:+ start:1237 stop:1389 length:153 start_codon:yes stop_codon:yes gene_type:complete
MNPDTYFEIYSEMISQGHCPDEAKCLMGDLEDAIVEQPTLDAWEWLDDNC